MTSDLDKTEGSHDDSGKSYVDRVVKRDLKWVEKRRAHLCQSVERLTRGKWRLTRRSLKQGTPNGKQVSSMLSELWGAREELFFQGDLWRKWH